MKLGVRGRLFLISLGLIVISVIAAQVYLGSVLDELLTDRIRADLLVRARLLQGVASAVQAPQTDRASWDLLADTLGAQAQARVTLIATDGEVLGDSELSGQELARVENHRQRPEVLAALQTGQGSSTRHSTTMLQRMIYVAVPFRHRDVRGALQAGPQALSEHVGGVVRVALPLLDVDQGLRRLRFLLTLGSVLAIVVAALLSSLAAHLFSRNLRLLTAAARRMASGDLAVRTPSVGHDEVGALGRALNHLAESLSATLGELKAERDLLSGILGGMDEGVLLLDRDGRIRLVNPALRHMLLLSGDLVGGLSLEVIRNADLEDLLDRARVRGTASGEIELSGIKPRRLLVHGAALSPAPEVAKAATGPLGGPEGEGGRLLAVFVDVTDLRRLESLRKDFVANVSHELRTPVTAVRSAAETLRGAALRDPAAAERFLAIIERNAERLQRLVEDLLDLSRIESRAYRPQLEPLELGPIVEHTLSLLRERADKKRLVLAQKLPPGLPQVRADRRALEQVLVNLIDNAVKYCPEGSRILVRAAPPLGGDGEVVLEVVDNGPGIDERHLPRLFERFYRVDTGRSRELGGTGLGLSIVKHLVEAMGGSVQVTSAVGQGATFTCRFPAAATSAAQSPPSADSLA